MKKLLLFLLFSLSTFIYGQEGFCSYVIDGDTFIVNNVKMRLSHVDAPELSEYYGDESKIAAREKILGRMVKYTIIDVDKYGRYVVEMYIDGENLSEYMVRNGYASVFRKYNNSRTLAWLEVKARDKKKGLWKKEQ